MNACQVIRRLLGLYFPLEGTVIVVRMSKLDPDHTSEMEICRGYVVEGVATITLSVSRHKLLGRQEKGESENCLPRTTVRRSTRAMLHRVKPAMLSSLLNET